MVSSVEGVPLHDLLGEGCISVHSLDENEALVELLLVLITDEESCGRISVHGSDLLSELDNHRLGVSFLIEELVVLDRKLCSMGGVVSVKVFGHEKLHKARIDEVFHVPDPLAGPGHSKLGPDGLTIASHEQGKEGSLRDKGEHRLLLEVVHDILGNKGARTNSIHSSLWREILVRVRLHSDTVTASKYIGVRGRLEEVVDSEVAIHDL